MTDSTNQPHFNRQMAMQSHYHYPLLPALECASALSRTLGMEQISEAGPIESTRKNISILIKPSAKRSIHQYRNTKEIPNNKPSIYVYPYADGSISSEHRERFPVIIQIFQQNLYEAGERSGLPPARTEYKLKMCGTCIDDARPSTFVCHPQTDK